MLRNAAQSHSPVKPSTLTPSKSADRFSAVLRALSTVSSVAATNALSRTEPVFLPAAILVSSERTGGMTKHSKLHCIVATPTTTVNELIK